MSPRGVGGPGAGIAGLGPHRVLSLECCWVLVLLLCTGCVTVSILPEKTCVKLKIRAYPHAAGGVKEQETSQRVTGGRAKGSSVAR